MIVISLILFPKTEAFASTTDAKTINVGFCNIDGFFELNLEGNEEGYGVDVLNAISKKTGITFNYVHADDWESLSQMLRDGEIDLMMPVSGTKRDESEFAYSSESVIYSYRAVMTKKIRTDLYYEDYDALNQMKIAAVPSFLSDQTIMGYFENLGVAPEFVQYDTFNECKAALDAGEVDALVSNIMDFSSDLKVLERFNPTDNYIVMRKGDSNLNVIDNALSNIKLDDASFFNELQNKYFSERNQVSFTKEESELISKGNVIKVGVAEDNKPLVYYDKSTKAYAGIYIDYIGLIEKKQA